MVASRITAASETFTARYPWHSTCSVDYDNSNDGADDIGFDGIAMNIVERSHGLSKEGGTG